MTPIKTIQFISASFLAMLSFTNCSSRFVGNPPPAGSCTFTINEPSNYSCFLNNANTGRKIMLFVNLKTQFINPNNTGPNYIDYDDKSITIDPSVTSFPITITANVPQQNFVCQVNMQGTECSTCANGYSIPDEVPYGPCPAAVVSTNPATFRAAKPRWNGGKSFQGPVATATVSNISRIPNVPNSCGCTVN